MKRVALAALGLTLWAASGSAAPDRSGDLAVTVVATSAPVADVAALTDPAGRRGLALLTLGPSGAREHPGALQFLPYGSAVPEPLGRDLPPGLTSLAGTTSGLLVGQPGKIHRLAADGTLFVVATGVGLDLRSVEGGRRDLAGGPVVARAGRITRYDLVPDSLSVGLAVPLPITAERALFGLRIETPPVRRLPATPTAPAVAVAGPLETGTRRLQSRVVDLASGASHEAWSLLPGDERLIDASFDRLGDRPVMLAVTLEQLGLLVEKRVRLFALPADRTRRGAPPILAFETDCPLWGTLTNHLADTDGDGAEDLVTTYSHGLTLGSLAVEVRRGRPSGGFDGQPRRVELSVEAADWRFAEDWTGDGRADLVVLTTRELRVYSGLDDGRRPVGARPSGTFSTLPEAWKDGGEPERTLDFGRRGATLEQRGPQLVPLDLDGDGVNELVALTPGKDKTTAVAVLRRNG